MEISTALSALESYDLWLVVVGLAVLATAVLPRLLEEHPLSMPIVLLALGYGAVALPLGLEPPDPLEQGEIAEHLTELGVIIALTGLGLKIDRRPGLRSWAITWRLLGLTMILTIGAAALVGWGVAGFVPATAMLFGAVISPTDPVLASDVQVGAPGERELERGPPTEGPREDGTGEGEIRFALTSEAGLNDGLVFPFTNMAILMVAAGAHPAGWIETWLLVDVLAKIAIAVVGGLLLGRILAPAILTMPAESVLAKSMAGIGALAATLLVYGATEYAGGYGFIATFLGAVVLRSHEREHEFHDYLHRFAEKAERLLTAGILLAFGGAVAGGLLEPLTWQLAVAALLIVFLVRPAAGIVGLIGHDRIPWRDRVAIAFYGVRGIGSLYYLAFALNEEEFAGAEEIWAVVGLVIVVSILVHGVSAAPVMEKLDEMRMREA